MVDAEESHAGDGLHEDAEAIDEECRTGLLDDDNVEKAVDNLGPVAEAQDVGAGMKKAMEAFRGEAHEDAPLKDFNDVKADGLEDGGNDEERENQNAEHDKWLKECSKSDGVDKGLGGNGNGQGKEPDSKGKDDGHP